MGKIDDGIKSAGSPVARVCVARSVESGNAVPDPIFVVRNFRRGHLRVDRDAASGNGIERVLADGLIESVREIEAVNVAGPEPAQIADAYAVEGRARPRILAHDTSP